MHGKKKKNMHVLRIILTLLLLVIYLFPIYWLFTNSVKTNIEIFKNPPTIWPSHFNLNNYTSVLNDKSLNIVSSLLNSLYIAVGLAAFTMLLSLPAAYGLAKLKMKLAPLFLMICIVGQMLSPTVKLLPLFIMFKDMGLINKYPSSLIALATYTIPFAILILRPFFQSVPSSVTESAMIDGCNKFTAFTHIMLPVTYPGSVVATIFTFLSGWNDLIYPMTFYIDSKKRPMIANMYSYISEYGTQWNMLMTFAVISVLPVVLLFVLTQRYIVGGITIGAVKG